LFGAKPNANEIRAFYGTVALASYLFGGAKAPLPSLIHWHWAEASDSKEYSMI